MAILANQELIIILLKPESKDAVINISSEIVNSKLRTYNGDIEPIHLI